MQIPSFIIELIDQIKATTFLEFVAAITGILSTYFSKKESICVFPFGVISTVIYIFISFWGELFAEAGLNIFYVVMNLIGWWQWANGSGKNAKKILNITTSNSRDWGVAIAFFALLWIVLFFVLSRWTPSKVPIADSLASASAYTGMYLMNRKKIESWYWWLLTDAVSIPLYFSKGYVFTSFQFLVFFILCIFGWIEWKKKLSSNPSQV